ncbi:major facilitator superfamily domain-containing protein, partial [Fennellomyces sp. T-0311]
GQLGIDKDEGDATGSLSTYSEVTSVIGVLCWGIISDNVQKRVVMVISLAIMGIITIAYPHAPDLYPTLLILRLIYSVGTAGTTCMMAAMMMEVVHGERSGLVAGLIGTASGLGAVFAAFVLFRVPIYMVHLGDNAYDPNLVVYSHATIGAVTIAIAIILYFLLPKNKLPTIRRTIGYMSGIWKNLYYGVIAAKDPHIALGYISSFFARADEVVITHFISIWMQKWYIEEGMCRVGSFCPYATATTATMTGTAQSVALVIAPFFGIASEYDRMLALVAAGAIGVSGCLPFAFSIDPTSTRNIAFVILLAMGQYGMIVSGMAMIARNHVPAEYRGGVAGMYSFCGVIGIIVVSKVGGVLFDTWMKGAPFLLLGIGHGLIALLALIHFLYHL